MEARFDRGRTDGGAGDCSAILLAGGFSSRMGCDKAALTLDGQSFLERQLCKLRALGIRDTLVSGYRGDVEGARVSTHRGSLEIPVEYTWQTARGYVMIPHYFGFTYQGQTYGTHVNLLTDNRDLDEITGNSRWRYTPCRVEAV